MPIYLPPEKRKEIYSEYGGDEKNSGSVEAQVALFTFRIKELSKHLQTNRKDFSCQRALLKMVGKRKRLLNYLAKKDIQAYLSLIERLGLRK